jgi:hypothetical protein
MDTWLVTIGLMGVVTAIMAVGVLFGRKPLQGSCGGVGGACHCINGGSCERKKLAGRE